MSMDDGVYVLTTSNFQDFVQRGDVFIKFYAPWCGHCKSMKPAWHQLGQDLNLKQSVKIAKVSQMALSH